ncbi:LysR family transcriptional regulator [Mesobaculum littorinae]|uniref:LysR family transcriptional regulator n=1 Tax=Mesobaculum littorinae TaxID=2486419 RepID=A0A438AMN2_9RHOB|nr:LysR substrate-binding domain-containing protein [Mesobaculum littorinae]RVV99857.1 LysR family transcriptional regulator [Mesobaculum littorinae]
MAITLKQLHYFVALAETGGFGTAAQAVHVSQPALSAQIRDLETHLGAPLVDRLPRTIRLTRRGQEVLARARRILAEVGDLEQAVRWHDGLSGRLHLGVIPTVAPYLLPDVLTRIRARDLTLDIRVREAQTDALVEALGRGQIDAAILALPVPAPGFEAIPFLSDRFLLAGSEQRLQTWAHQAARLSPHDLVPEQLLLLDEGHCLADQALEVCGIPARRQVDLGASSLSTLCGLVSEGFGLTLLPELAVRTEAAAARGLRLMRFAAPEPQRDLALVHRGGGDGAWAADLAGLLRDAGSTLVARARDLVPVAP